MGVGARVGARLEQTWQAWAQGTRHRATDRHSTRTQGPGPCCRTRQAPSIPPHVLAARPHFARNARLLIGCAHQPRHAPARSEICFQQGPHPVSCFDWQAGVIFGCCRPAPCASPLACSSRLCSFLCPLALTPPSFVFLFAVGET